MKKIVSFSFLPLLCFIVFILFSSSVLAQEEEVVQLRGVVTDKAGNPLIGANVFIPELGFGASTDVDGFYFFTIPAAIAKDQAVVVRASYIGY